MYDQFDKKLSDRIKLVFDNYEDDSANAGWQELRKSFPGRKERPKLLYWISSAAAVILLCAGVWMFMESGENTGAMTGYHKNALSPGKTTGTEQTRTKDENNNNTAPVAALATSSNTPDRTIKRTEPTHLAVSSVPPQTNVERKTEEFYTVTPAEEASQNTDANRVVSSLTTQKDTTESFRSPVYARKQPAETSPAVLLQNEPVLSTAEKLARLQDLPNDRKPEAKKGSKVSVGVFAGSFFNYSEGSKTSVNTGVGLLSELAVSKKLKISTGVTLAQNTLKFDNAPAQKETIMMSAPVAFDEKQELTTNFTTRTSARTYSVDGYDASLLGLDIPVNIKYMFLENKRDLYVAAGLSSNIFIDESYTYKYSNNSYLVGDSKTEEETTTKASSFDFARMLNLSVGFGYPVGKQSKLSFEPFVKYPLAGLGSQDIRFGAAGINLKLNFSTR